MRKNGIPYAMRYVMSDLIDTDDILNHLKNNKISREEIYRLSDNEGFGYCVIKTQNVNNSNHQNIAKSAQ